MGLIIGGLIIGIASIRSWQREWRGGCDDDVHWGAGSVLMVLCVLVVALLCSAQLVAQEG